MAIVKMKRIRLMAVQSQREEIMRELMLLGCVEFSEPEEDRDGELLAKLVRPDSSALLRDRADQTTLQNAVRLLDLYAPVKKKLLSAPPDVKLEELLDESRIAEDLETAGRIIRLDEKIRRVSADESRERSLIESLRPWETLDVPLECDGTEVAAFVMGAVPATADLGEMESAILSATECAKLYPVSADKLQKYVALVCTRAEKDDVLAALRPYSFSTVTMGELKGTAQDNIQLAKKRLEELAEEKKELTAQVAAEAPHREELKLRTETIGTRIARSEAGIRLLCTESAFAFEGWMPASDEGKVAEVLAKYDCAWETEDPDPEKPEEVPVKLKNNAFTKPFNMVTGMYSYPAYNGIDPNPFLFPTFALFFGIMFADIGYGAIMILVGLLLKYKLKAKGMLGNMGGIALICGASCVIFGAVTGTFFGDIVYQASSFFGGNAAFKGIIDPLGDPMSILVICIVIGVIHMFLGVGINAYMLIRDGQWKDAIWDAGSVYFLFISIGLAVLVPGSWWVAVIAVVFLIAAQGRSAKSIGGKIGSGLYGLYNFVSGWFGDILSYSRLMALMLAGGVIAQVFNTLGVMTGNIVTFVLIFIVGHLLNFLLNIIGTYVHSSRLEYLEFFGKFYREGGRLFSPLEVQSKHYNICK